MIHYITTVYREWNSKFDNLMYILGYLLTALCAGCYYYTRGIVASLSLKNKEVYDDCADGFLDKGDIAFECFLNQIQQYIPDKLREYLIRTWGHP